MTDRETVNNVERMKVTTCLNPLHTALAVYGCLLGYTSIAAEMRDPQLGKLVERIGYDEGMPVVVDPGILSPRDFIAEVIRDRLPNPFIPEDVYKRQVQYARRQPRQPEPDASGGRRPYEALCDHVRRQPGDVFKAQHVRRGRVPRHDRGDRAPV